MEGWKAWVGKIVYIRLKNNDRSYQGEIIDIDERAQSIYITLIDKNDKRITVSGSEITFIQEESERYAPKGR